MSTLWFMLLCWASSLANAQTFNSLYANSPQIALTQPLEWVAVAKGTMATPDLFEAQPDGWRFQLYDASTVLPTSTQQEVWARFALPMTEPSQTWFVRIPRITVNRVSLFSRDLQGNWQSKSAGDAIAPAEWALRTRTPSFELHTSSSAAQTYYLRFENRNAIVERPMLISPIDYVDGASRVGILIGFLLGMMGLLSVLCLGGFVITGSALFLWFGGFAASLMVSQLVILGYGGWRLWPHNVHLNQVMGWASSCVALATGAWFCAKASYAKDSHIWIYRLLSALAIGSLMLALLAAFGVDVFSRDVRNIWAGIVVTLVIGSLAVMAMSGQPWNGLLLVGLVPIGLATMARLAYNLGWVSQIELAQTAGVFAAVLGLLWLMLALAWRSRASLLATALAAATEGFDAATGLTLERIARRRLPQLLLRASRLKLGCGVIMIGWADHAKIVAAASPQDSAALFAQIGHVLRKVARDIDTAARFGDARFMILVEGPVSRQALSSLSTQILTMCIRASEKMDTPGALNLHIAIWQSGAVPSHDKEVIEALQTRLNHMSFGTKRPVQFVDALTSNPQVDPDPDFNHGLSREELIAKIDAIEAAPSMASPLSAGVRRKSKK